MKQTTKKQILKACKNAAFFAAYVCVFVCFWNVCHRAIKNEYLFPPLKEILKETKSLFSDASFYAAFLKSMKRVLSAFLISFTVAAVFAVIAYLSPLFEKIFAPITAIFRALPTMAIILIILIFSTPSDAPVIVAFLALFPVLYTGIFSALSATDEKLTEMCRVYRVPVVKRIFSLYLPTALPQLIRQASGGISFAIKLVVSAEVVANTFVGVGGMIQLSKMYFETPRMFALTILVVLTGLIAEIVGIVCARAAARGSE